jgi:hypothetical protein
MNLLRRGQMARQLGQVTAFMLEGFGRNQPPLALGPVLHAHRRPFKGLAVEILELEALKGLSSKSVSTMIIKIIILASAPQSRSVADPGCGRLDPSFPGRSEAIELT